jgi:membrane-associated phospholipid phosphatase
MTKKVSYKRILIFASIGVFPLIIVSPITTHMHHLLLGRGGVLLGVLFVYVAMGVAQQRGNAFFCWVRCQATARKQQSGGVFLGVRSEDRL